MTENEPATVNQGHAIRMLAILAGVMMVAALGLPTAQASLHEPYRDLSATVEAGEYVAYRVEMPSSGWVFLGGEYDDVSSDYGVLPIVNILDSEDRGYSATTGFYYDTFHDEIAAADVTINNDTLGHHNVHTHEKEISSSPFPGLYFYVPSGVHTIVSLTGPADGEAEVFVEVPIDTEVLGQERGDVIWANGLTESSLGYQIKAQAANRLVDYHEWYYSGADVEIDVEDSLYGYLGFSSQTEAHWEDPNGEESVRWVVADGPSTWTMSFPEEHFQWRNCVANTVCVGDQSAPYRIYPPFGVAADVGLAGV